MRGATKKRSSHQDYMGILPDKPSAVNPNALDIPRESDMIDIPTDIPSWEAPNELRRNLPADRDPVITKRREFSNSSETTTWRLTRNNNWPNRLGGNIYKCNTHAECKCYMHHRFVKNSPTTKVVNGNTSIVNIYNKVRKKKNKSSRATHTRLLASIMTTATLTHHVSKLFITFFKQK